jgi:hypothetical protein
MNLLQKLCLTSVMLSGGSAFGMSYLSSFANGARQAMPSRPGIVGGVLGCATLACARYYTTRSNNPQAVWWKRMLTGGASFDYNAWLEEAARYRKYMDFINSGCLEINYKFPYYEDKIWDAWVASVEKHQKPFYKNTCHIAESCDVSRLRAGTLSIRDASLAQLKDAVQLTSTPITPKNQVYLHVFPEVIKQMITDRCEEARLGKNITDMNVINGGYKADLEKFYARNFIFPYFGSCALGSVCGMSLKYLLTRKI